MTCTCWTDEDLITPLQKYQTEFLEIWFQTIAFPKLINQHKLTSALVNMEIPSAFFTDVPFTRDPDSNKFVVELSDLQASRVALLRCKMPLIPFLLEKANQSLSLNTRRHSESKSIVETGPNG